MVKFTIKSENIKRFTSLANSSKEVAASTEPYFIIKDNRLMTRLYSPSQMMSFDCDLDEVENLEEDGLVYFTYSIIDFNSTILRVSNDAVDDLEIVLNQEDSKVSFRNKNTDTVISIAVVIVSEKTDEITDALNYLKETKETTFKENTIEINITQEIASFFDTAIKLMVLASSDGITTNAASIKGNKLCFATTKQVFEKELSQTYTSLKDNEYQEVYLQKRIFDFLKPFLKSAEDGVKVVLNSEQNKVLIESNQFGFSSVLGLEAVNFIYPTSEELECILPDPNNTTILKTSKSELKKAIDLFIGTFKTNWNKSPISLSSSKDTLENKYINFSHKDSSAECVTKVGIIEYTSNGNDVDMPVEFDFNSASFNSLLNLVPEDELEVHYSASIDYREIHGAGLLIKAPGVLAICCKNVL